MKVTSYNDCFCWWCFLPRNLMCICLFSAADFHCIYWNNDIAMLFPFKWYYGIQAIISYVSVFLKNCISGVQWCPPVDPGSLLLIAFITVKVNKWIGVGVKLVINGRQQLGPFSQWHFLHAVFSVSLFSKGCPGSSSLMRKHVAPVAAKQGGCMKGSIK